MTELCDVEWSCLAPLDITKNQMGQITDIYVQTVYIPEQTCSGADTEMDDLSVIDAMEQALDAGHDSLKGWFHSHVNMGVFWSNTDETCIERLCVEDILLSIVVNKKGEYRARIDQYVPFRHKIDEIPIKIDWEGYTLKCEAPDGSVTKIPVSTLPVKNQMEILHSAMTKYAEWCEEVLEEKIKRYAPIRVSTWRDRWNAKEWETLIKQNEDMEEGGEDVIISEIPAAIESYTPS